VSDIGSFDVAQIDDPVETALAEIGIH